MRFESVMAKSKDPDVDHVDLNNILSAWSLFQPITSQTPGVSTREHFWRRAEHIRGFKLNLAVMKKPERSLDLSWWPQLDPGSSFLSNLRRRKILAFLLMIDAVSQRRAPQEELLWLRRAGIAPNWIRESQSSRWWWGLTEVIDFEMFSVQSKGRKAKADDWKTAFHSFS
jgi:hypothetical protein